MNGEVCVPLSMLNTAPTSVAELTGKGFKVTKKHFQSGEPDSPFVL